MRGQLVLLMGRSFSGKTTWAAVLARELGASVVSLDAINEERGLHGGEGVPVAEWQRTNEIGALRVTALLSAGRTVIVDDTSSPRFLRDRWRRVARSSGARFVLVHVDTAPASVRRRLQDNRRIGARGDMADAVMDEHLAAFVPPEPDEPHVGVVDGAAKPDVTEAVRAALDRRP